jgi:hypothetical protein
MKRLQERLAPYATLPMLLGAAMIFIAHVAALRWFDARIDALSGAAGKPDLMILASPSVLLDTLTRYGAAGRTLYTWSTLVDTSFPLSVAWLGVLLLVRAWPRQRWMLWLPLAFCCLDLVENALLLVTLARFPAFSPALGWLVSLTTSAKLLALAPSYALMLAAVLRLAGAAWPGRHTRVTELGGAPGGDRRGAIATRSLVPLAAATAALCILLAPVQSLIWNGAEAPRWLQALPWLHPMIAWAEQAGLGTPYFFYGRLFLLVHAGVLATLWMLARGRGWLAWPATRWLLVSLGLASWGDFLAYWASDWLGDSVRFVGFWMTEVPALVSVALAGTALGVSLRRAGHHGAWLFPWLLLAPSMLLGTAALAYMPHGPMLAVTLACLALTLGPARARQPAAPATARLAPG